MNTASLRRRGYSENQPKDIINTYTYHFDIPEGTMKSVEKWRNGWVVGAEYIIEGTRVNGSSDWALRLGNNQHTSCTTTLEGSSSSWSNTVYWRFIVTASMASKITAYSYKANANCYVDVTVTEIIHPS